MNNEQKTKQALQHAIERISQGQMRKALPADLQILLLNEINNKLDTLIQLQQQDKQAERGTLASDEIPEPEPEKKYKWWLFGH